MKSVSLVVVLLLLGLAAGQIRNKGWWKNGVFYQIYPRSFMDSNDDGIGDLKGITSKLEHFKETGITGVWLSPIYASPNKDFGYDISDFRDIHPDYGTLQDLKDLVKRAKELGIKVILDLVPNHTADKHYWFQQSLNGTGKYKDYYIWHNGTMKNGKRAEPNNWISVFNGTAWTYSEERKQYYFHQFYKEQPDLNYANPEVQEEMKEVMRYWLNMGIDGFRIDAVPHIFEGNVTQDEPPLANPPAGTNSTSHAYYDHVLTKDQPQTYELLESWRQYVDKYAEQNQRDEILLMTEAYTSWENTLKYYKYGANVPFNFKFIMEVNANSSANDFKNIIDKWLSGTPPQGVANWVMGNHDRNRVGTRYPGRGDQMIMLEMILPGVAVSYYGEEIGMVDYPDLRQFDFRDGCRTPFQWNADKNAGFSKANKTWLPVHESYKTVNLEQEKKDETSPYKLYTSLINMRKSNVLRMGTTATHLLKDHVLAVVRNEPEKTVTLLMNFSPTNEIEVDLSSQVKRTSTRLVLSAGGRLPSPTNFQLSSIKIPASTSIILESGASLASYSITTVLLLVFASLFRWSLF